MGQPGSGKGTQSVLLSKKYKIPQISTGDILRKAVQDKTPMGLKAKEAMDAGELASDDVVIGIVRHSLENLDTQNGYILDGFPRTVVQATSLQTMLKEIHQELDFSICLGVSEDILLERLLKRAKEENRSDDTAEVIQTRIKTYQKNTYPLLKYYNDQGILVKINGLGSVEDVSMRIQSIIS